MTLFPIQYLATNLNPNLYIDRIPSKYHDQKVVIAYLWALYNICQSSVILILVIRNLRIYIVLRSRINNKYVTFFIKQESLLIALLVIFFILMTFLEKDATYCLKQAYFGHSGDIND